MFKRITPKKISDEIVSQIKELLSTGKLAPGDKLPSERELAKMIGVGRPSLREALNALQAMGYLEIRPRHEIIVKSVTEHFFRDPLNQLIRDDSQKIFELLEFRRVMESWAAQKATERATEADIAKLSRIIETDQTNLRNNKDDAKIDADFHMMISQCTHNTLFCHFSASCYGLLWDSLKMARDKIFTRGGNRDLITDQHLRIYEAIIEKDPIQARRAAESHIDFVEEELRRYVAESDVVVDVSK